MNSTAESHGGPSSTERFASVPLEDPGTPAHVWQAAADGLPEMNLAQDRRVLVIVAHPDDEVLGPGGLVSTLVAQGTEVETIICSDGDKSHAHDPAVDPAHLGVVRREESRAASSVLGTSPPTFLGYPDGDLAAHQGPLAEKLMRRITGTTPPLTLLTHWQSDGHPDHEAVSRAVREAGEHVLARGQDIEILEFPVWALHWDSPYGGQFPLKQTRRGHCEPTQQKPKREASACFTSQVTPWPQPGAGSPVMPEHVMHRLLSVPEMFVPVSLEGVVVPDGSAVEEVDGIEHLRGLYADSRDPWDMESSDYEKAKRAATLAALPRDRYGLCFEPGCSIGVLTAELAQRADRVVGWEPVESAAVTARTRCDELVRSGTLPRGRVTIEQRSLSALHNELGPVGADLVVISEVLYFLPRAELADIISGLCSQAAVGAHVVAVHWKHPVTGWPGGGAETHQVLEAERQLRRLHRDDTHADYLLEVFETVDIS